MRPSDFEVVRSDPGGARLARFRTTHGAGETPAFMPVGTYGSVKGLTPAQLRECGASIILLNAYQHQGAKNRAVQVSFALPEDGGRWVVVPATASAGPECHPGQERQRGRQGGGNR